MNTPDNHNSVPFIPKQDACVMEHTITPQAPEVTQRWDELETVYQSVAFSIVNLGDKVRTALHDPGIMQNLPNPVEFNILVKGFYANLTGFSQNLVKIHDSHKGRSGPVKQDIDEHIEFLNVFEHYNMFNLQFLSVTESDMCALTSHISAAEKRRNELSTTHVTDVQLKEIINAAPTSIEYWATKD